MMAEIDKLEGEALAKAVALKQGWEEVQAVYSRLWRRPGIPGVFPKVEDYRPDLDIGQSWDLIEVIRKAGMRLYVGAFSTCYDVELHAADKDHTTLWEASARTVEQLPAVICRAFLEYKEIAKMLEFFNLTEQQWKEEYLGAFEDSESDPVTR